MLKCPSCEQSIDPRVPSRVSAGLAPTGGDYEWVESGLTLPCPLCDATLDARVRSDLGGHGVFLMSVRLGRDPEFCVGALEFDPSSTKLLASTTAGARIFELREQRWSQTSLRPGSWAQRWDLHGEQLVGWREEDRRLEFRSEALDGRVTAAYTHTVDGASSPRYQGRCAVAYDARRGLLVSLIRYRDGEERATLEVADLRRNRRSATQLRVQLGADPDLSVCFDLARDRALVARRWGLGQSREPDALTLWELDPEAPAWRLRAERAGTPLSFLAPQREPAGDWLVVSWLNERGTAAYDRMPYGLARFDGETLIPLAALPGLPPQVARTSYELRRAMLRGDRLWWHEHHHGRDHHVLHRIELPGLACHQALQFERAGAAIADVSADGRWAALGFLNRILVLDAQTGQGWEFRRPRPATRGQNTRP